jgi:hypothetical protein
MTGIIATTGIIASKIVVHEKAPDGNIRGKVCYRPQLRTPCSTGSGTNARLWYDPVVTHPQFFVVGRSPLLAKPRRC